MKLTRAKLRSYIGSVTNLNLKDRSDRKLYRFMGDAAFAYLSTEEAIKNANCLMKC